MSGSTHVYRECYVIRSIGYTLEYDANMPPGPVKLFTNKIRGCGNKPFKLAIDIS